MLVDIFINIILTFLTTPERDISEVILTFPSPCAASSQAFSVNAFSVTYQPIRTDHVTRDSLAVRNNEATERKPLTAYANSEK